MSTDRVAAAALIGVSFMGSGLITPLYALYQKEFGFSEVTLTLIYAAYVVGNLTALLFFGKISDLIGRKRVAIAAIAAGCISVVLFFLASGTQWLFLARTLSGVFVGLASGTGTAWLVDSDPDKDRATLVASVANAFGFAVGPLAAGLLGQYTSRPLMTPFYAYLPLVILTAVVVACTHETADRQTAKLTLEQLRPRVGVPKDLIGQFIAPAITAFGTYALVGYYAALIPTILAQNLHRTQPVLAGAIVFELAFLAGIVTIATRKVHSRMGMLLALASLLPSVALLLLAESLHSLSVLLAATAFGSVCWGLGIRGSLQVINEISPEERRAELASSYYIAGFVGNSIPVIGIGAIASISNPLVAGIAFGCTIAVFAVVALYTGAKLTPVNISA